MSYAGIVRITDGERCRGAPGPARLVEFQQPACRMLIWADPPDDVRVDDPPFDRRQVLLDRHSKCDNAIAQGWIGDREFHTARIGFADAGVANRPVILSGYIHERSRTPQPCRTARSLLGRWTSLSVYT